MKLMSVDKAIREEQEKNNAMLEKVKKEAENKKKILLWGSIATIIAGVMATFLGVFLKAKAKGFKLNADVE